MKNNTLKKISAVALAAVMAVTFAPVASLNAFAANADPVDHTISGDNANVTKATTYKVTAAGTTINVDGVAGDTTIDLNGYSTTINTVSGAGVNVIITNTAKLQDNAQRSTDYPTLTVAAVSNDGSIEIANNSILRVSKTAHYAELKLNDNPVADITCAEVAADNDRYVGNAAIQAYTHAKPDVISAVNGAVSVEIGSGDSLFVSNTANLGTTVAATAEANVTLQTYKTTYSFKFDGEKSGTLNQTNSSDVVLTAQTGTYVDTRYAAGTTALENKADIETGLNANDVMKSGNIGSKKYLKALKGYGVKTLDYTYQDSINTTKQYDWSAETAITYDFKSDWVAGTHYLPETLQNEYYTMDPTTYARKADLVALVDGTKYSDTDPTVLDLSVVPGETLKFVKAPGTTNAAKNSKVSFGIDFQSVNGVAISGPADLTIAEELEHTVSGTTHKYFYNVSGWGVEQAADETFMTNLTKENRNENWADAKLIVPQVSSTATVAQVLTGVDKKDKLVPASGIGYYYKVPAADVNDIESIAFGTKAVVTKDFELGAQGGKINDVQVAPMFASGDTVFASNEIQTTVKSIDPSITFIGETSATVTATDENGKRTWLINGAVDVNTPQNVYRFRNVKTGDHLYTMVQSEIQSLITSPDWELENSNAFKVLPWNTTVEGAVKVLRFRNKNTGEYLYSTDPAEQARLYADPNWEEGYAAFAGVTKDTGYAVYRVRYAGGHVYCTSKTNEVYPLIGSGRGYELDGTVFFATDTPEKEK